jgi:hypothetical protein
LVLGDWKLGRDGRGHGVVEIARLLLRGWEIVAADVGWYARELQVC